MLDCSLESRAAFVPDFKMLEILLPVDFVDDLSAQGTQIVADLAPVWLLVGGVLLGFGIIAFVVGLLAQGRNRPAMPQMAEEAEDMDNEMP